MARQNQGLQIALIVFVLLTLGLGVTTFFLAQQSNEAKQIAKDARKKSTALSDAFSTAKDENERLKKLMGFPPSMEFSEVNAEVNEDINTYAANFEGETRGYHQVVAYLHQTIQDKMNSVAELTDQLATLEAQIPAIEAAARSQIQTHAGKLASVQQQVQQQVAAHRQTEQRLAQSNQQTTQELSKVRTDAQGQVVKISTKLKETGQKLQGAVEQGRKAIEKLSKLKTKTFETPDGEVRFVDHKHGKVWINLGRADSLPSQITFAVYPADVTAPSEDTVKGSIEVTSVTDDHLAEARIISDSVRDPIMRGDKIYTPIWEPGEQRRFALAGVFDLNDDGRQDLDVVRNLITMNGGKVDAVAGADGKTIGQMTLNTRYLVLGEPPSAKGRPGWLANYGEMKSRAEDLGVETIPVSRFLDMMGYRPQATVRQFGDRPGGNAGAFRERNRATEGAPRRAGGSVSELYERRQPPRGGAGGAY